MQPTHLQQKFQDRVRFQEPLAPWVAYRVGGPADALVFPENLEELEWLRKYAQDQNVPVTILGHGTNLLVLDGGIRGISVLLRDGFSSIIQAEQDPFLVHAGGGVGKAALLNWALDHSLSGLEFSAGVPGTIGGGIFMNAGTKYGCYADILESLLLFSFQEGASRIARESVFFGYRHQSAVPPGTLVVEASFRLRPGDPGAMQKEVSRIIAERTDKQPLDFPSCGSTFKNPEGHSAGRLIEKAGLKGFTVGQAQVSLKHANFILNLGNAKAADIVAVIQHVEQQVLREFGVQLEKEVIVVGEATS